MESGCHGQDQRMGHKTAEGTFQIQKKDEETWIQYCTRTARAARHLWKKMKLPFLSEIVAEGK